MKSLKVQNQAQCDHTALVHPDGLALVTIGNSLGGGDDMAASLCDVLPETALKDVCRFDLGSYTGFLAASLAGHKAAIIVDSTCNGTAPGTVSILDLTAMLDRAAPLKIESCHGFALADELRLAKRQGKLPRRIIFFGVEVGDQAATGQPIPNLKLSQSVRNLSFLVLKVLETLKRDA